MSGCQEALLLTRQATPAIPLQEVSLHLFDLARLILWRHSSLLPADFLLVKLVPALDSVSKAHYRWSCRITDI